MKHKFYLIALFVVIAGVMIAKNNSQEIIAVTTHDNNKAVPVKKNVSDATSVIKDDKPIKSEKNTTLDIQTSGKSYEKTEDIKPAIVQPIPAEIADSTETQYSEIEPTPENSDMPATGEYADEINLPIEQDDCTEPCDDAGNKNVADGSKVNIPAVGDHADQINTEAMMAQAPTPNNLPLEGKLTEASKESAPPTQIGAYTPPN